jgi:hypothetical protein
MSVARALPLLVLGFATLLCRAEEVEPLDADFLLYLASLESEDGDWTELADEEPAPKECKPAAGRKCPSADEEDAVQPAAKQR